LGLRYVVHPEGDRIDYIRNARGDLSSIRRTSKDGTQTTSVTAYYDDCSTPIRCGRPTRIVDPRGATTNISYYAHGGVDTVIRPAPTTGAVRPEVHNTYAQLHAWYLNGGSSYVQGSAVWRPTGTSTCATTATCPGGASEVISSTTYEAGSASVRSNLLPLTATSGSGDGLLLATTTTTWDSIGDPVTVDGPLVGDVTRYFHDAMRQQIGVIGPDPDGAGGRAYPAAKTHYNPDGQVDQTWRGTTAGQTPSDWDAFASLQTSTTLYDAQGRKTRDTAFVGSVNPSVTQYSYDAAGRLICTAVRMNPATFGSLPPSACTPATIGSFGPDRITQAAYDPLNRPAYVQDGVGTAFVRTERAQAYTLNGQIDWVEDANGNRSDYVYDGFDRLSRLNFPMPTTGSHAANPSDYEAYTYDAADNPTGKVTRAGLSFVTTFDALNRITLIDAPAGTQDVAYLYDNLDRRTGANIPGGLSYTMTWDALGRQTSETGPLGTMASQFDLAGRRTRLTWPDTFYVSYTWDLDGAMRSITQGAAATPITAYTYDNLGQRTGITRGNGVSTSYVRDNASYLTTLSQNPSGATNDLTLGFTWSPAGQALSRSVSNPLYDFAPVNAATAYANNGLNQNTLVGGVTLTWNTQGNLTSDGVRTFSYDAANRLTGTTGSALTWDPLDRLYQMTGTSGGRFQYDGDQVAAVYPAGSSTVAERYVRGPGPDEWAVIYTGSGAGSPTYPLQNHQASVIALTDATGAATSTLAFDEYGRPRSGNLGRFQYTGQMMLPDYGLQHYKARAYHAGLGRFVQTDPVGYEQGLNLYAYVANDPVNNTDPTGLLPYPGRPESEGCVMNCDSGEIRTTIAPSEETEEGGQSQDPAGPSNRYDPNDPNREQPGYQGGPTPPGYTDQDGTGRFMVDQNGRIFMNPNYRAYLRSPDSRIDWVGVTEDLLILGAESVSGAGVTKWGADLATWAWGLGTLSLGVQTDRELREREREAR
jgi:RHS repeat-associated protein